MSSCRIERKRAHDREAQRASRAKTKAYIAHLEKTVADLSQSSGDGRANYLARHASKQQQEIDSLQGLVSKIRSLVQEAGRDELNTSPPTGPPKLKLECEGSEVEVRESTTAASDVCSATYDSPDSDEQWGEIGSNAAEQKVVRHSAEKMSVTRNLIVAGINMLCEDGDDTSYLSRLNEVIAKIEKTPDDLSTLEEDQDILIRAIVCGWDAAERVHHFDIVWRFLRAFDEGLWYRAAPLERFAHFWNMRTTMLNKIQPRNQERRAMAPFMAPTVGQQTRAKRPPVVDYFGWPQVRNHLIAQGINECSGKSSIAFTTSFRFEWAFEVRDVYKVDRSTGLYTFSGDFLKSFNDLSCYQMVQNLEVPHYCHPSLAQSAALSTYDCNSDSSSMDDDDEDNCTNTVGPGVVPSSEGLMHDAAEADWTNFAMDISSVAAQYGMDPFSVAHEATLYHWPTV